MIRLEKGLIVPVCLKVSCLNLLSRALFLIGGTIFGSFLNVIIYRMPRNLPFIRGRSYCPKCRKKISWYDNIPLLSFIVLKGRCRNCRKKISFRYPLVELLTGVFFVLGAEMTGGLGGLAVLGILRVWLITLAMVAVFFIDLEWQIIPDQIVFPLILVISFFSLITTPQSLITNYLPTAVLASAFFYFLHWLTRGKGMGLGDVKFVFLIGLILGYPLAVVSLYLAFLTGAIAAVILILTGRAIRKQRIAFGPFLAMTCLAVLFWGEKILWLLKKYF